MFDRVVMALHSDQALEVLSDADDVERSVIGAIRYQPNTAVLHTDQSMLPARRKTWASWNVHVPHERSQRVTMTYHMNRLQNARQPARAVRHPQPRRRRWTRPRCSPASPTTTRCSTDRPSLPRAAATRCRAAAVVYWCGAYWGYGFHEDGARSGFDVAAIGDRGRPVDAPLACVGRRAALYEGTFAASPAGSRSTTRSRYRVLMAYLDLSELPAALDAHPLWSARRSCAGRVPAQRLPRRPRRSRSTSRCATPSPGGPAPDRVARSACWPTSARGAGSFNPIAFYLVFDEAERIETLVAEVTNTPWHERTAYVLDVPSEAALASDGIRFPKAMHVSPFMDMDLDHVIRMTRPGASCVDPDGATGGATTRCSRPTSTCIASPLDRPTMGAALRRHPLPAQRVSAGIYWEALKLRVKGAPFRHHPSPPNSLAQLGTAHL